MFDNHSHCSTDDHCSVFVNADEPHEVDNVQINLGNPVDML